MPGGDRTGPAGFGPMSGRALGYCAGYEIPGFSNPGFGRGYGFGRGRGGGGRGWRNQFYATGLTAWQRAAGVGAAVAPYGLPVPTAQADVQNVDAVKAQAKSIESTLDGIRRRIDELEAKSKEG